MPAGSDSTPPAPLPGASRPSGSTAGLTGLLGPLFTAITLAAAALLALGWALPQLLPATPLAPAAAAALLLVSVALLMGSAGLVLQGWLRWSAARGAQVVQTQRAGLPASALCLPGGSPPGGAIAANSSQTSTSTRTSSNAGANPGRAEPGAATTATAEDSPLAWQINLLRRLPGLSMLLQPATSDWVVIAVHRAADGADSAAGTRTPWADLPIGLSHERLQPLSQLLAAHPPWPASAIRDCVMPTAGALPDPTVRQLPLPDGACVVWLSRGADAPPAPLLDERESIAYSVSHDLRAPIRVIEGFTRIVREDYGQVLDRVGNDHLDRVLGATTRMNSMIDALLALSRLSTQPLARQAVPLSDMARQITQELRAQAAQRRVEFDIQPGLIVQGDPTLLHCLLDNLLGNAWKYTARRECAHISLSAQMRQLPADEGSNAPAQRVFEVSDNGAGFDMRFAERLFSPFQRLHSASEFAGNGVGLASVRRIVQRHGGEIWAEAEVDRGARFHFTLA